ncbi:MAG: LolA family protein [Acidimicrobiales bacterium]
MTRTPRPLLRWLVAPLVAAALVASYAVLPTLAGADAPPALAPITARDLVAKVSQASVPGLSGTITSTPHLGLPDLSSVVGDKGSFLTSLLTGAHTMRVWQAGGNVRLALPSSLAEDDVVRSGSDVWVWQSNGQQASHLALKGEASGAPDQASKSAPPEVAPTPQSLADHFLASVDPTTRVSVRDTVMVAGQPAYELVLAPKSSNTLVADVVIAVDSATGLPLRVQVLSRDSGTPAIDLGFSSVDFSVPAASTFAFTPPPGAKVTEAQSPIDLLLPGTHTGSQAKPQGGAQGPAPAAPSAEAKPQVVGSGWESVAIVDLGATGNNNANLAAITRFGSPVQGSWGSGRLVRTSLVNLLLTDHNTLLVGSVPEAALEAAAAGH